MKKLYLGIILFMCFFVFSLDVKAANLSSDLSTSPNITQLDITMRSNKYDKYNNPPNYKNDIYNSSVNIMGYNVLYNGVTFSDALNFHSYLDYIRYKDPGSIPTTSSPFHITNKFYDTMYKLGANLPAYLESLLPANSPTNKYYTISYYVYNSSYIDLFLVYYPEPIVYNDLDGLQEFDFESTRDSVAHNREPIIDNNTFSYRFKVTSTIEYVSYTTTTYRNILNSFNFNTPIIIKYNNVFTVAPYFYNFFYMSNFSIFPNTTNVQFVPGYVVNRVHDTNNNSYIFISDDIDNYYGLNYLNKYAFSGATVGIKPFYSIINPEVSLKPPYSGGYSQISSSWKKTHYYLEAFVDKSVLYYNGSLGLIYTENSKPTTKRSSIAYTCVQDSFDEFCTIQLDFTGLENPGFNIIADPDTLIEDFNMSKENAIHAPTVWYKTNDFNLFLSGTSNFDKLICFGCEPDENGNLPSVVIKKEDLKNFLQVVEIESVDGIMNISSVFRNSYYSSKGILNASIEILNLVSDFYNSFSTPVKSIILMIFVVGILAIFIRMIM